MTTSGGTGVQHSSSDSRRHAPQDTGRGSTYYQFKILILILLVRSMSPSSDPFDDIPDRETIKLQKFGKLLAGPNTDLGKRKRRRRWREYLFIYLFVCLFLEQLRKLSWSGIPSSVRATTWQLLCVSNPLSPPPPPLFCLSISFSPSLFIAGLPTS